MQKSMIPFALAAALLLPGLAQARQAEDPARYAKAFQRGLAKPAPPRTLAEEARCSAAWQVTWSIYWINTSAPLPTGYDRQMLKAQAEAWFERLHDQGETGEAAFEKADAEIIQPLAAAGQREKVLEIAGACGRAG